MKQDENREKMDTSWWESAPPRQTTGSQQAGMTETWNSDSSDTTVLAEEWLAAKQAHKKSQARLDRAVTDLIQDVGIKADGAQSFNSGEYKITTTASVNYSVDMGAANRLLSQGILHETLWHEIFKTRLSLGKVAYAETLAAMPELAPEIQRCLTSKTGKPQARVDKIQNEPTNQKGNGK